MKLLLLSNSTNPGEEYFSHLKERLPEFISDSSIKKVAFIPDAAVLFSEEKYLQMVQEAVADLDLSVESIHNYESMHEGIEQADCIMVGGGNTFKLIKSMQDNDLLELIRSRVQAGVPYIGWSAGSNVACPAINTTNDMPIVFPGSFEALGLIPFQINPHFTLGTIEGHGGESRKTRLFEYVTANQSQKVVGLEEGTAILVDGDSYTLLGADETTGIYFDSEPKMVQVSSLDKWL